MPVGAPRGTPFPTTTLQNLRSTVTGRRPAANTRQYGEMYVNLADKQIGMIDSSRTSQDLVGVRFFSTAAGYSVGDHAINAGTLYRCITAVTTPGPFTSANWSPVLPTNALGSMAMQNAPAVAITGGTINGTTIGNSAPATGTFGTVYITSSLLLKDLTPGANSMQMYRSGNTCYFGIATENSKNLSMDAATGNIYTTGAMTVATTLNVSSNSSIGGNETVGGNFQVNGGQAHFYNVPQAGFVVSGTGNHPLNITVPNGEWCGLNQTVSGVVDWYVGPNNSSYSFFDLTHNHSHIYMQYADNTLYSNDVYVANGDNGRWGSGQIQGNTVNGYVADGICSTTGNSGYSAYNADVNNGNSYFTLFTTNHRATVVGSINTNGTNTFYNTSSDGRLKEKVRPLAKEFDVGKMIDAIEPVAFEWTHLPDHPTGHGFVAQDLIKVAPEAVWTGYKSLESTEEYPHPWGVDFSKLVPYMIAELQALRKRVAELEAGHA